MCDPSASTMVPYTVAEVVQTSQVGSLGPAHAAARVRSTGNLRIIIHSRGSDWTCFSSSSLSRAIQPKGCGYCSTTAQIAQAQVAQPCIGTDTRSA